MEFEAQFGILHIEAPQTKELAVAVSVVDVIVRVDMQRGRYPETGAQSREIGVNRVRCGHAVGKSGLERRG